MTTFIQEREMHALKMKVADPPACVLHEDEHILAVDKPAGLNTHSPSPYAGEGIYDWLRNREPRWASLAIIHRLDKATSGVMVFAKTKIANASLTRQFTDRKVQKSYVFLTGQPPKQREFTVACHLMRQGEKYVPVRRGEFAETAFRYQGEHRGAHVWLAEPRTGRTHQIRVQAQMQGISILGDALYGGREFPRLCLHAWEISFAHPASGENISLRSEVDFFANPALLLRAAVIDPLATSAYRLSNGAADGLPHFYLDKWGLYLLSSRDGPPQPSPALSLRRFPGIAAIYHKSLERTLQKSSPAETAPVLVEGESAPDNFVISENGVRFEISFRQGYSTGLFLDQRENRRRLMRNYIAPGFELFADSLNEKEVLNCFAYTCGFSVCAALGGARTTSLDLSRKYLDWGKRNFMLNGIELAAHGFIHGDVFDWAPRLARKGRQFDAILLDPPTFSHAKGGGAFQAERDYGRLITTMLPLLKTNGVLFASCNAAKLSPEKFVHQVSAALACGGRREVQRHYVPQPIDFPITREDPAYLKTIWLRVQ